MNSQANTLTMPLKDMSPHALFDASRGHYLHTISQALHRADRISFLFAGSLAIFMLLALSSTAIAIMSLPVTAFIAAVHGPLWQHRKKALTQLQQHESDNLYDTERFLLALPSRLRTGALASGFLFCMAIATHLLLNEHLLLGVPLLSLAYLYALSRVLRPHAEEARTYRNWYEISSPSQPCFSDDVTPFSTPDTASLISTYKETQHLILSHSTNAFLLHTHFRDTALRMLALFLFFIIPISMAFSLSTENPINNWADALIPGTLAILAGHFGFHCCYVIAGLSPRYGNRSNVMYNQAADSTPNLATRTLEDAVDGLVSTIPVSTFVIVALWALTPSVPLLTSLLVGLLAIIPVLETALTRSIFNQGLASIDDEEAQAVRAKIKLKRTMMEIKQQDIENI